MLSNDKNTKYCTRTMPVSLVPCILPVNINDTQSYSLVTKGDLNEQVPEKKKVMAVQYCHYEKLIPAEQLVEFLLTIYWSPETSFGEGNGTLLQ